MVEDILKRDPFLKNNTYLLFDLSSQEFIRWNCDKTLFFAGSKEDAMFGNDYPNLQAIEVIKCPEPIQKEYELTINKLIKNGGL